MSRCWLDGVKHRLQRSSCNGSQNRDARGVYLYTVKGTSPQSKNSKQPTALLYSKALACALKEQAGRTRIEILAKHEKRLRFCLEE